MKKTLSFILALVMMFCLTSTASAADGTTLITFTKPDPFTYTLNVPATTDFEDATSHSSGLHVFPDKPTFTLSDKSLLVYDETEYLYYIKYAGQRYEVNLTATCNGMSAGGTTYDKTGFDTTGGKERTDSIYFEDDSGNGLVTTYSYWITNEALEAMAPGTYTDTITYTVSIVPKV